MKRRNADTGKLRRPIKRTKITEGMYGNSMLYLKFVLLWSSIALADYMLEFRFEFLWPLWLLMKGIYHCYLCKGLSFSVFFTCVALLSDIFCYYFIPIQMLSCIAGLYVWMNSIYNTFICKGVCAQTLLLWLIVAYGEALRTGVVNAVVEGTLGDGPDDWINKPWPASALGFPIATLGVSVKQVLDEKLRMRTQRQVRAQNEFYFRLLREAIPEGGLTTSTYTSELLGEPAVPAEAKQNGCVKRRWKPDTNGHCVRDKEPVSLQAKIEHLEQYVERKNRARDSSSQSTQSQQSQQSNRSNNSAHTSVHSSAQDSPHAGHSNGHAKGPGCPTEDSNHCKGGSKSSKCDKREATTLKEESRRKKNRDIDKETNDSHKSKENKNEHIDLESAKESAAIEECNNILREEDKKRDEERKREKEERKREKEERRKEEERKREREEEKRREKEEEKRKLKERERELKAKEKEKEKEKERERELLSARECAEEVTRLRAALAASQRTEAETARLLAAATADRQRRASHSELKQLQHKMSTWRCGERAAMERKLGEERRLRLAAEQQLQKMKRTHGECESEWCRTRRTAAEAETASLKKDLQKTRDRLAQVQLELTQSAEQMAPQEAGGAWRSLRDKAAHLEQVLSAETRVKLDLLSALGDANRKMHIQENILNRHKKELEELKAQMLAVMPAEFVSVSPSPNSVSKMRLSEGSPLDPNATIYTPKQLCSDA